MIKCLFKAKLSEGNPGFFWDCLNFFYEESFLYWKKTNCDIIRKAKSSLKYAIKRSGQLISFLIDQ
jgi:hypothetical protein